MKNLVLTSFLNSVPDPQRKVRWETDIKQVMPLVKSVVNHNETIVVFHDCFDDTNNSKNVIWKQVTPRTEFVPNVQRWFYYLEYLTNLESKPELVFMVDATDVTMLSSPFEYMKTGIIYTGDEQKDKMKDRHSMKWLTRQLPGLPTDFQNEYKHLINTVDKNSSLVNCGLFGCNTELAIEFLEKMCLYLDQHAKNHRGYLDTTIYVYTLFKHYSDRFIQGKPINTVFKGFEDDKTCWWKHK